jgi:hypothetical protein
MFKLRDYQSELAQKGCKTLQELGIVYYSVWMRLGKSLTALECARLYGAKRVLFLAKANPDAMSSIKNDYAMLAPGYELDIINDESLHKIDGAFKELKQMVSKKIPVRENVRARLIEELGVPYDLVIHDEHHRFGSYAKPALYAKVFKKRFAHLPMIFLSGTPSAESFSQLFHQFWVSDKSPFPHPTFTQWAKDYVRCGIKYTAYGPKPDYDDGIQEKIMAKVQPYMLSLSQEEAGFNIVLNEFFCKVPMPMQIKMIADRLMRDGVVQGKTGTLSADNAAALKQKIHQLHSGTILLDEVDGEERKRLVLSAAKAEYIANRWPTEKLVIFYSFKAELLAIQSVLGDRLAPDLKTFRLPGNRQSCAYQVVAGREGLNLSAGELLVFFNTSHSAVSFWQARERLTTIDRVESNIYWLFSDFEGETGIDKEIYNVVMKKKDFTTAHFKSLYKKQLHPKFLSKRNNARVPDSVAAYSQV